MNSNLSTAYSQSTNPLAKWRDILFEIESIKIGDFLVHKDYGIGQFVGIERLLINNQLHDCVKLLYYGDDKLFIPVENINLLKGYGNSLNAVKLDKLGSSSWQKRKEHQKKVIFEFADAIIHTATFRKLTKVEPIKINFDLYNAFISDFGYKETKDQASAIYDVEQDLFSERLMNRLICGDVGFGKTEVAMRAAFLSVYGYSVKRQVIVICPTTLLCKQHYHSFKKRFSNFDVNIVEISGAVNKSELKQNKLLIKEGKVDIIIGTHALFNQNIGYKNLSLLIIDEEQHFGVKQKEHFQNLKEDIHILSLSATPIPRTLQMSLAGIRDLSIISTPPVNRFPVEIIVQKYDLETIKHALLLEFQRNGQSFYICPRIADIDEAYSKLTQLLPELKIKTAHGQMKDLENVMLDVYYKKCDLLISTTIVESGLDISNVNTIIVDKAEKLGMSQLYQLRGRIGRGSRKAYAYFFSNTVKSKNISEKFEALEKANYLGAGFMIANYDLDIRGYGNLIGFEQSGQVKEIGVELYQEMLEQAVSQIMDTEKNKLQNVSSSVNLGLAVYIPENYIPDNALRLGIYRRIGALNNKKDIDDIYNEMTDRFGSIPEELHNLLIIMEIKQKCAKIGIEQLDVGPEGFILKFIKSSTYDNLVLNFIEKNLHKIKVTPSNKIIIKQKINNLIEDVFNLLANISRNFIDINVII